MSTEKINRRSEVCNLIYNSDADDLDVYIDAIKRRHRSIREQRAVAVTVGAKVRTVNLTPKAISGLTGTVTAIRGKRADLLLDDPRALDGTRLAYNAPNLNGVPLTALEVL